MADAIPEDVRAQLYVADEEAGHVDHAVPLSRCQYAGIGTLTGQSAY